MRFTTGLYLSALVGAVCASPNADVYILQNGKPLPQTVNHRFTLTPEQARFIFAQRLGVSRYHDLGEASMETFSYINMLGGQVDELFLDQENEKAAELVMIVEGATSKHRAEILQEWPDSKPAFIMLHPPSLLANQELVNDLQYQSGQNGKDCELKDVLDSTNEGCWARSSRLQYINLAEKGESTLKDLVAAQESLIKSAKRLEVNIVLAFMPIIYHPSNDIPQPYGVYETSQQSIERRQAAEEPMADGSVPAGSPQPESSKSVYTSNSSTVPRLTGVPRLCHESLDSCMNSTYNCSGHGECFKKYGSEEDGGKDACFTCGCKVTNETRTNIDGEVIGWAMVQWGGSACHKRDISSQFWLITVSTALLVGVVTWGIGLLFSVGEEKLPGVIGAGVSSKSR